MLKTNKHLDTVQNDINSLYLGNLNTVEFDLNLPIVGQFGSTIQWESSNSKIISDEGKVTRPIYGHGNRDVELFATFTYADISLKRTYLVTVLEEENRISVKRQFPLVLHIRVGLEINLPNIVVIETQEGKIITHPVTWEERECKCYENEGSYAVEGYLNGTEIGVKATIHVTENDENVLSEINKSLHSFDSGEVRLIGESSFKSAQDRTYQYLLSVDDDQMLFNFRRAAGLDTLGAPEMSGWDSPEGLLRGHTTGHYLSALALCYRSIPEQIIKKKIDYMVEALVQCQDGLYKNKNCQEGFLSAYNEEQFDLLEVYTRYPIIWAPYYTLHKIMAGLLDCYRYAGSEKAFIVVSRIGDWVCKRLLKLSREQLNKMWSMYIAGEFGGMNEVMAELYQLTHHEDYLKVAKLFDNDKLYYPLSIGVDALNDMHANQHIPQMLGALKIFDATKEGYYYRITEFFWEIVTRAHCYVIGGTGEAEMFHAPKEIGKRLSKNTAESCASYNMLKLTKELYTYDPKVAYMDYYERTMVNHILATCDCESNGSTIYFMPLVPGYSKDFDVENSCCHGTGLENHFKYVESLYYWTDNEIYINQFVPSFLDWHDKDFRITMLLDENKPGDISMQISGRMETTMKIRIPYWSEGDCSLYINGIPCEVLICDGYLSIKRSFLEGDIICVAFPCRLRIESAPDVGDLVSVFYGPYCLAAITDDKEQLQLTLNHREIQDVLKQEDHSLVFRLIDSGTIFKPIHHIFHEKFQVYIKTISSGGSYA